VQEIAILRMAEPPETLWEKAQNDAARQIPILQEHSSCHSCKEATHHTGFPATYCLSVVGEGALRRALAEQILPPGL
jgi:hypothetical protein